MSRPSLPTRLVWTAILVAGLAPASAVAQGTLEDYVRADSFRERTQDLVIDVAEDPNWIEETSRFWYRKSVEGGDRFVLVNPAVPEKGPAFDHDRLAAALTVARQDTVTAVTLPFRSFEFVDDERAIEFVLADSTWRCELDDYACENQGAREQQQFGGRDFAWSAGPGQRWRVERDEPLVSPDSTMEAFIHGYNVAVRKADAEDDDYTVLTHDGSEGNQYTGVSLAWSPDSRRLAVYRVIPGHERAVHYVASSPDDQLQPVHSSRLYAKPGDVLDREQPVILDIETGERVEPSTELFPNAYSMSDLEWREDGERLTFEYNQRGHEVYRIIEVDATTGATRAVISEEPETFFDYSGKMFRHDVNDGEEIIWMSERDGWNHLYLYDGETGRVKNQITGGEWVVRDVDSVDVDTRTIWFEASGMNPDQDPYFVHQYSISFDGSDLTAYTEANGTHEVDFSPDMEFYVDRWSRVDHPPVALLRRTDDRSVVMELERADDSALLATGWRYPEVFVSKARDGETDIWGIIVRPTNFDSTKTYPVIESIYAGPHGSFVPKSFSTQARYAIAELGFIVVQIDGMGTSDRSKAFHDVAWQNIKDAGFPDRILWHRAVAEQYPYYDIDRVGIYGTSAGGQNSMGALLFHPEFYDVAVSAAGCHDNRMDKIWWNEQWMGWPIAEQYVESSNVENAHLLEGDLLLILPEMDTNVDPSSTLQVVNALIEAGKDFDFLMVPGADHGIGGDFGVRKRNDFFVQHLLGVEPPAWNRIEKTPAGETEVRAERRGR